MKTHVGDLDITKDSEIDFDEVTGNITVKRGVKFVAKKLTTVGGNLYISSQTSLPKLTTVGGDLDIRSQASIPKLTTVGGYLDISSKASLPKLTTVGGYLNIYSKASLPKLTTVGGYLYISSQALLEAPKLVNKNDDKARELARIALEASFAKHGLIRCDGILSWLKSKRRLKGLTVFRVQIVGKLIDSFVVQRGDQFSHGETVEKAIESLRYKLSDRDTTRFKKWTLKTKISLDDAIQAYRAITGACEFGVRNFVESQGLKMETLTVSKAIEITKGQYGSDEFRGFFK